MIEHAARPRLCDYCEPPFTKYNWKLFASFFVILRKLNDKGTASKETSGLKTKPCEFLRSVYIIPVDVVFDNALETFRSFP